MNIDTFFAYEGLTLFNSSEKYWQWVYRFVDKNSADKIKDLFMDRAKGNLRDQTYFYDFLAQDKFDLIALNFEYSLLKIIAHWVEQHLPPTGTIIELGCNTGFLCLFYAIIRPEAVILGIDNSEAAINQAKKRMSKYKVKNLDFIHADAIELGKSNLDKATCIITGRLLTELFTPIMRFRENSQTVEYQVPLEEIDMKVKRVISGSKNILTDDGLFLVTERFPDFDRFGRLQGILHDNGFSIIKDSLYPISWDDVGGHHISRFFSASKQRATKTINLIDFPLPTSSQNSEEKTTRFTLHGIIAYQVWKNLTILSVLESGKLKWAGGQEIFFQAGNLLEGLYFTYISSNTDINMLSIFEGYEYARVKKDLDEYVYEMKKTTIKAES